MQKLLLLAEIINRNKNKNLSTAFHILFLTNEDISYSRPQFQLEEETPYIIDDFPESYHSLNSSKSKSQNQTEFQAQIGISTGYNTASYSQILSASNFKSVITSREDNRVLDNLNTISRVQMKKMGTKFNKVVNKVDELKKSKILDQSLTDCQNEKEYQTMGDYGSDKKANLINKIDKRMNKKWMNKNRHKRKSEKTVLKSTFNQKNDICQKKEKNLINLRKIDHYQLFFFEANQKFKEIPFQKLNLQNSNYYDGLFESNLHFQKSQIESNKKFLSNNVNSNDNSTKNRFSRNSNAKVKILLESSESFEESPLQKPDFIKKSRDIIFDNLINRKINKKFDHFSEKQLKLKNDISNHFSEDFTESIQTVSIFNSELLNFSEDDSFYDYSKRNKKLSLENDVQSDVPNKILYKLPPRESLKLSIDRNVELENSIINTFGEKERNSENYENKFQQFEEKNIKQRTKPISIEEFPQKMIKSLKKIQPNLKMTTNKFILEENFRKVENKKLQKLGFIEEELKLDSIDVYLKNYQVDTLFQKEAQAKYSHVSSLVSNLNDEQEKKRQKSDLNLKTIKKQKNDDHFISVSMNKWQIRPKLTVSVGTQSEDDDENEIVRSKNSIFEKNEMRDLKSKVKLDRKRLSLIVRRSLINENRERSETEITEKNQILRKIKNRNEHLTYENLIFFRKMKQKFIITEKHNVSSFKKAFLMLHIFFQSKRLLQFVHFKFELKVQSQNLKLQKYLSIFYSIEKISRNRIEHSFGKIYQHSVKIGSCCNFFRKLGKKILKKNIMIYTKIGFLSKFNKNENRRLFCQKISNFVNFGLKNRLFDGLKGLAFNYFVVFMIRNQLPKNFKFIHMTRQTVNKEAENNFYAFSDFLNNMNKYLSSNQLSTVLDDFKYKIRHIEESVTVKNGKIIEKKSTFFDKSVILKNENKRHFSVKPNQLENVNKIEKNEKFLSKSLIKNRVVEKEKNVQTNIDQKPESIIEIKSSKLINEKNVSSKFLISEYDIEHSNIKTKEKIDYLKINEENNHKSTNKYNKNVSNKNEFLKRSFHSKNNVSNDRFLQDSTKNDIIQKKDSLISEKVVHEKKIQSNLIKSKTPLKNNEIGYIHKNQLMNKNTGKLLLPTKLGSGNKIGILIGNAEIEKINVKKDDILKARKNMFLFFERYKKMKENKKFIIDLILLLKTKKKDKSTVQIKKIEKTEKQILKEQMKKDVLKDQMKKMLKIPIREQIKNFKSSFLSKVDEKVDLKVALVSSKQGKTLNSRFIMKN